MEWNIWVKGRKEINWDPLISSERNGDSPNWISNGNIREIFGCGTAAVIAKISSFGYKEDKYEIESVVDSYADKIKESIVSIQQNLSDDPHGWRYKVDD